jgi:peptidoglycan-associated lipoprotein
MTRSITSVTVVLGCLAACGSNAARKPVAVPSPPVAAPTAPAEAKPPVAVSPNVAVSDDLAKQCRLQLANVEQAPKFGYDDVQLLPPDRVVLDQIAECLTSGPLRGRGVQLVGRADPRGTDEYNLALGTRRAETVRTYLERLGVPATRLSPTTRGELDASGRDESGWQRDRRVDLQLLR